MIEHRVHSETLADDPFPAEGCPVRLYACAGCAERSPRRDLVECVEGNHDDLTYFHGDVLCRAYADGAGVEY